MNSEQTTGQTPEASETMTLDTLRQRALRGELSRRGVLKRAVALGLSAPVVAGLLAACGGDDDDDTAATATTGMTTGGDATATVGEAEGDATATTGEAEGDATATTGTGAGTDATATTGGGSGTSEPETPGMGRGEGDMLRILYWQAATNLNPHYSQGNNNSAPAAMVLEPLLYVDQGGTLRPVLIDEVPSLENGGLSEDGLTVTYTLKEGLLWSDGTPFTSEDARFTWEWVTDPASGASSALAFQSITDVEIVDERTFKVIFEASDPTWYNPFSRGTSLGGQIVPKHLLQDYMGADAASAPFNLAPIGTGPYKVSDFRPGDLVMYEINENYRDETRPFFSQVEFKGGGDATSAARAVFQTNEADYAMNLQVEKAILEGLIAEGNGELVAMQGGNVEQVFINFSDPNTEVDGARSEPSTTHPFLTDIAVRQALRFGSDAETVAAELYGPTGVATSNIITAPDNFVSPNTSIDFDIEMAKSTLEEAGWMMDGNVRAKDGVKTTMLFQTTVNPLRQKTQEILKQSWEEIGFKVELKSIDSSVFFSADAGNPDTWYHFYADVQMVTLTGRPFPIDLMKYWKSTDPAADLSQKSNGYAGPNMNRWINEEFNELWEECRVELDPARQKELFIAMNDLIVTEVVNIPLIARPRVDGRVNRLKGQVPSAWSDETYDIANWYFEE